MRRDELDRRLLGQRRHATASGEPMITATAGARDAIIASRLIALVRTERPGDAARAVEGLAAAGVRVVEISLTTPDALDALEQASKALGEQALIGAGTIRTPADAERAVTAGAAFLAEAPNIDVDVLDWATERDVLHLPGCFSPSELALALERGAHLVKLFPASRLGPDYVHDLLAPFPAARLVPTGGITTANARAFLDAGAVALAVGSALVNEATLKNDCRAHSARAGNFKPSPDPGKARGPHGHRRHPPRSPRADPVSRR